MATQAATKDSKPKAAKAPAAKKEASAAKAPAKKTAEKKEASAKPAAAHGKIKVTQIVGTIARKWDQEATLIGLGLNKRHRSRVLEDTACVRGMVYKVRHLVTVEQVK